MLSLSLGVAHVIEEMLIADVVEWICSPPIENRGWGTGESSLVYILPELMSILVTFLLL